MSTSNLTLAQFVKQDAVSTRLNELLGKRAPQFITSLVSAANANNMLQKCQPESIVSAALTAASMDLPINPNLGFAHLIPYGNQCQFQMGYKGFIQLAQRSGFYKTINATDIRAGEMKEFNRLTGEIRFEFLPSETREQAPVIGYAAFFELLNGFQKTFYMTHQEMETHAKKYSKQFAKSNSGLWADSFDTMAKKTVLKLLISKFGPLSTQLQEAIQKDQTVDGEYADNPRKVEITDATLGNSEEAQVIEGEATDEE